jgi:hypothetical protein
MKKVLLSAIVVAVLALSFASVAAAGSMSPGQFCNEVGRDLISTALEEALYQAHGIEADVNISQGACASTVATHNSANGVNTQALATSFCKEVGLTGSDLAWCVDHVEPTLLGIFHGS